VSTPEYLTKVLDRLDRVKQTSPTEWQASSPIRRDEHPSLSIGLMEDGKIVLHDHAAPDSTLDILKAIDLTFLDLRPPMSDEEWQGQEKLVPSAQVAKTWTKLPSVPPGMMQQFATSLGLTVDALGDFELAYHPSKRALAILETNAYGGPVGIQYRTLSGTKFFHKGGGRGIVGLRTGNSDDTAIICEGWSDTVAVHSLGFPNVLGRPSATCGADTIAQALKCGRYHNVIVIADPKPQEQAGARKLADSLKGILPVKVITPPDNRDARAWINAGASRADFDRLISEMPWQTTFRRLMLAEIEKLPKPRFQVDDLFPENSLVVLYGPYESGKSFIALDLALSIQAGIRWSAGGRDTLAGRALYIAGEGAGGLGSRVKYWKFGHSEGAGKVNGMEFVLDAPAINTEDSVTALINDVRLLPPPSIIILDTLARTMCGDENSSKDMGAYVAGADRLRRAFQCTVVIVHHSGKNGDMRGSSALDGAVDVKIRAKRDGKCRSIIEIACEKQKDYPHFETFWVHMESPDGKDGSVFLSPADRPSKENADTGRPSDRAMQALAKLRDVSAKIPDGWVSRADWLSACKIKVDTFNNYLGELRPAKLIERAKRGKHSYFLPAQMTAVTAVTDSCLVRAGAKSMNTLSPLGDSCQ
jgi:5S rRNA maturation endonuclease (ribonuclease M5)